MYFVVVFFLFQFYPLSHWVKGGSEQMTVGCWAALLMEMHVGSHVEKWHCWLLYQIQTSRRREALWNSMQCRAQREHICCSLKWTKDPSRCHISSSFLRHHFLKMTLNRGQVHALFPPHLYPHFLCGMSHLSNHSFSEKNAVQWSWKEEHEWVSGHEYTPLLGKHNKQTRGWKRCFSIPAAQGKLLEGHEPSLFSVRWQQAEFWELKLLQSL